MWCCRLQVADTKIKLPDALFASVASSRMSMTDCEEAFGDVVKMENEGLLGGL